MDPNQDQGKSIEERIAAATATEPQAAEEKQPEPMPSSEPKQTEGEAVVQDTAKADEDDLSLPEGASERTRQQFEKLKARLAEKEKLLQEKVPTPPSPEYGTSVFDGLFGGQSEQVETPQIPQVDPQQFPNLNQQQQEAILDQYVAADGTVDIDGLNKALQAANQRAVQAEMQARQAVQTVERFEETQQVREAHTVHPDLDPKAKEFDPDLFNMVRDRLVRNWAEGKKQTLLQVTNDIKKVYSRPAPVDLDKVKTEAVEQYKQAQEARNQGPIESGKGENRATTENLEDLRQRTRQGDPRALDERLRKLGIL